MTHAADTPDPRGLVGRLWSYCELLRHSGVSTLDYVEQLTYLLFLKMADERANRRINPQRIVPEGLDWPSLVNKSGDALHDQYEHVLGELALQSGNARRDLQGGQEQDTGAGRSGTARQGPDQPAPVVQ